MIEGSPWDDAYGELIAPELIVRASTAVTATAKLAADAPGPNLGEYL